MQTTQNTMTNTALVEVAQRHGGHQFTQNQHQAIDTYYTATAALPDFEITDLEYLTHHRDTYGEDTTLAEIRYDFAQLSEWYEALDSLYSALVSDPAHNEEQYEAGRWLVEQEANQFFHQLNRVRRESLRYLIGTAGPCPEVDSGFLTFCDVPPKIRLDGTAVAESQ